MISTRAHDGFSSEKTSERDHDRRETDRRYFPVDFLKEIFLENLFIRGEKRGRVGSRAAIGR